MQDCELLYLSGRPENLLMTTVAVPPIAIRPSVIIDGSQRSSHLSCSCIVKLFISLSYFDFIVLCYSCYKSVHVGAVCHDALLVYLLSLNLLLQQ